MKFKVALLQITAFDDLSTNLEKGIAACRQAKALAADLVLFPELWSIGATTVPPSHQGRQRWINLSINQQSNFFLAFAALAKELEMNIAITYLETHEPLPKDTVSILDRRGEVALDYSKVFICDFGKEELHEPNPNPDDIGCDVHCTAGKSFGICTLNGAEGPVKVGAMICADREFPEPATQLMLQGAEIIVVPNACKWDEIRTAGLKTRAFENLVGVAMANYAGKAFGCSQAHSCVAWRDGKPADTLISRAGEGEEIVIATFDVDEIRAFRETESWRLNYRKAWYQR